MKSSTYVLNTCLSQPAGDMDLNWASAIVRLSNEIDEVPNGYTRDYLAWLDSFLGKDDPAARRMRQLLSWAVDRDGKHNLV
jgi:hypothetical protein